MSVGEVVQATVGYAAIGLGVLLFGIAAIGLLRFRDGYSRLVASTKSGTLGVCTVLLGVLTLEPTWGRAVLLLGAVALQIITAPVGGFALGRAAFRSDAPMPAGMLYDELHADVQAERSKRSGRGPAQDAGL